jgi:putative FmdB family regulatory protein
MGLFEYKCDKCANVFKIWKHVQPHEGEHDCNKCGGKGTPVWAASMLQFKGDGWYVNDSKSVAERSKALVPED